MLVAIVGMVELASRQEPMAVAVVAVELGPLSGDADDAENAHMPSPCASL